MPISGPNSYPSTMNHVIQHWTDLNTVLGTPLVLSNTRNVALLTTWLAQVQAKLSETTAAVLAAAVRKGELDVLKEDVISWSVIFNATMRSDHSDLSYVRNLVPAPQASAGRGQFLEPLVQTMQIWTEVTDALAADVEVKRRRTLTNGTIVTETLIVAGYAALIESLQVKWNDWTRAQQKADNVREQRNDVMALAYETMKDYRAKVPLELPPGHALLDSLPALSPDPAKRPVPPGASGEWNAGTSQADLTGTASPTPTVVEHELRYSPDTPYNADNEVTLVTIPAGQPLTFSTDIGLAVPGDVALFSWVAVTADGHEGRSTIVSVTRT